MDLHPLMSGLYMSQKLSSRAGLSLMVFILLLTPMSPLSEVFIGDAKPMEHHDTSTLSLMAVWRISPSTKEGLTKPVL